MFDIELILVYLLLDFFLDLIDTTIVLALQLCIPFIMRVISKKTLLSRPEDLSDFF